MSQLQSITDLTEAKDGIINPFISASVDSDMERSASQISSGSLSSDGSTYILTGRSDTFTITSGLLDTLSGGLQALGGADSITGSGLGDIISGDEGDDRIEGLDGGDLLYGGAGNDFLSGGAGKNGLLGGEGADTLQGGENADAVNGNAGDDAIFGAGGDDFLRGGRGNDIISGEDGDDFLIGDLGNDTLTGGMGQDVFFLRSEAALGSPTFDLITDFQKTIDFIGLSTNLKEGDILLESKIQPSGASAVDIKVAATGALLGTVLGVTPEDLRGRFRAYNVEPDRPEEVARLDFPEFAKLSDNKFQMELPVSDGSKYIASFQDDVNGPFVESVRFLPNPTTGIPGSTTRFNRDGTQAEISVEGSNETVRIEYRQKTETGNQDEGLISRIKDGQIIDSVTIPVKIEASSKLPLPASPATDPELAKACESLKEFCEGTNKVGSVVDFAANTAILGGTVFLPLEAIGVGLKGVSTGLKVVKYACILLTGSDLDVRDAVVEELFGKVVENVTPSGELAGELAEATGKKVSLALSTVGLFDSFLNKKKTTSKTNLLPQIRKWLTDKTGIQLDFCDKSVTPTPNTPTPTTPRGEGTEVFIVPQGTAIGMYANREIYFNGRRVGIPPKISTDGDFGKELSIGKFQPGTELVFEVRVQPLEGDRVKLAGPAYSVFTNNPANAKIETFGSSVPQIGIEDGWVPSYTSIVFPESKRDFDDAVFQVINARVQGNRILVS